MKTTLVLVFKKVESDDKSMTLFIETQKQKKLSMKVALMMCLNQTILKKVEAGLLIQSLVIILVFQK